MLTYKSLVREGLVFQKLNYVFYCGDICGLLCSFSNHKDYFKLCSQSCDSLPIFTFQGIYKEYSACILTELAQNIVQKLQSVWISGKR